MADPLPVNIAAGALSRDPACHVCSPHPHHPAADCDWCRCGGDVAPGL